MKSIRSKIMSLLFCSVLIVSLIIGTFGIVLTSNIIKESSTENMRLLCKNNADKIDLVFAKVEESVNTLVHYAESELYDVQLLKNDSLRASYSSNIRNNSLHHIENIDGAAAVYMHYNPSYIGKTDGFYYVKHDAEGELEYHPLTDIHSISDDELETVPWWHVPTSRGTATWLEAYYDTTVGRYVVSYVVPMYKGEQMIGIIGVDIFAEYIVNLVKEVSIFNSGQAAVLKSDGTILYHPHFARGVLIGEGDPGFDGVIDKLTKEDSTKELISYQLKGEDRQLASCKLRNGMLMICFAPESEIYREQTLFINATIVITAAVVLTALLIGFMVSKKMTRPIKQLNEAAKHMTDGEFDFNLHPDTQDEIGELTETFIETRKILQKQIHLLDREAHVDGLTGIGNKGAFDDRKIEINKEIASGNADFSVVVFDVNKLKITNDVFGHMVGDKLLSTFANHLTSFFDPSDVYRLGGDEFVVIIPEDGIADSKELIASCIEGMKSLYLDEDSGLKVSCAYGACRFNKETDNELDDVFSRADIEMYKNKTESKKESYPWQKGSKGLKELQIEKYCALLKSLKESTDDYLYLINLESGVIRFFGGNDNSFNMIDDGKLSNGIEKMLNYIHVNDRSDVRQMIYSVINRDAEEVDINFRMINNGVRWINCRGNVIRDDTNSHFVMIGRISQNAVKHLYNPITVLFNKTKLKADLKDSLIDRFEAMMLIDIDNLTEINLKHGSVHGDKLLLVMAEELEKRFATWQLYHVEKDRFAVLLETDSNEDITGIFNDIKESVSGKFSISASIVPNDSASYVSGDNIYDFAVQTLINSKKNGIGQAAFFSKDILLKRLSAVELLAEFEESVRNNCKGFHLVYQPQISTEDYSIVSAEALLRFKSETKGVVYPDQFIPILEETGLINEVGLWVAEEALCQCKKWREYNPEFRISVNISPKQLKKKDTAVQIIGLLSKHDLPGEALIIEITESAQLDESEDVYAILKEFHDAGILIAIDDFGTGYSNLGKMKSINANILKIDRIFIKDIKKNGYNYNLIYNIMEFAKSNSLKVCLEGVETKEELIVLSGLKSDIFQGYLFDRPCPADVIEAKYFIKDSDEYSRRIGYIDELSKEKRHALMVNVEMKTILSSFDIGLWIIRINNKTGEKELYADDIMKKLLGVEQTINPADCFSYWQNGIIPDHRSVVNEMISNMADNGNALQIEYHWNHPQDGEKAVRFFGRCTEKSDDVTVFEGFQRIIE